MLDTHVLHFCLLVTGEGVWRGHFLTSCFLFLLSPHQDLPQAACLLRAASTFGQRTHYHWLTAMVCLLRSLSACTLLWSPYATTIFGAILNSLLLSNTYLHYIPHSFQLCATAPKHNSRGVPPGYNIGPLCRLISVDDL